MYNIIRFFKNGENKVIATVKTLERAQEWCKREDTHTSEYFDGYAEIKEDN